MSLTFYDTEFYDLLDFLKEKSKNSTPCTVHNMAKEYEELRHTRLTISGLRKRIDKVCDFLWMNTSIDLETRMRVLVALRAPCKQEYFIELEKEAFVTLDSRRRIIEYREKRDGGLWLKGNYRPRRPESSTHTIAEIPLKNTEVLDKAYAIPTTSAYFPRPQTQEEDAGVVEIKQEIKQELVGANQQDEWALYSTISSNMHRQFLISMKILLMTLNLPIFPHIRERMETAMSQSLHGILLSLEQFSTVLETSFIIATKPETLMENQEKRQLSCFIMLLRNAVISLKAEALHQFGKKLDLFGKRLHGGRVRSENGIGKSKEFSGRLYSASSDGRDCYS